LAGSSARSRSSRVWAWSSRSGARGSTSRAGWRGIDRQAAIAEGRSAMSALHAAGAGYERDIAAALLRVGHPTGAIVSAAAKQDLGSHQACDAGE